MAPQRICILPVGLLLLVGTLGCPSASSPRPPQAGPSQADSRRAKPTIEQERAIVATVLAVAELKDVGGQFQADETDLYLSLRGPKVTDATLEHVKQLTSP